MYSTDRVIWNVKKKVKIISLQNTNQIQNPIKPRLHETYAAYATREQ